MPDKKQKKERKEPHILVYCDGSHSYSTGLSGWGAVILIGSMAREYSGKSDAAGATRIEMVACIEALKKVQEITPVKTFPVRVYSDSKQMVDVINAKLYVKWIKRDWKTRVGFEVSNRDLWEQLVEIIDNFENITFHFCYGHTGIRGNERADALAKIGRGK